jgi:hypothetical protein
MSFFSRLLRRTRPAPSPTPFHAGQVWCYQTRPTEQASTALVLSVDTTADGEPVIHVQVRGVALQAGPGVQPISVIGHMPVSKNSFEQSVTSLLPASEAVPDHSEALSIWLQGGGGIWAVPLASAIGHLESTLMKPEGVWRE